jgi:hypothetical protein
MALGARVKKGKPPLQGIHRRSSIPSQAPESIVGRNEYLSLLSTLCNAATARYIAGKQTRNSPKWDSDNQHIPTSRSKHISDELHIRLQQQMVEVSLSTSASVSRAIR